MSIDIHLLWCHDPNYLSDAAPWVIYKLEWIPVRTGIIDKPNHDVGFGAYLIPTGMYNM